MENTLYRVTFSDGRMFKVFCANKAQKNRFHKTANSINEDVECDVLENGIHNIKQWEQIVSEL